ncbi:unnamed protein product [Spodoptera exigua]|nr:unnamed protein product [Spodoptera exigua]
MWSRTFAGDCIAPARERLTRAAEKLRASDVYKITQITESSTKNQEPIDIEPTWIITSGCGARAWEARRLPRVNCRSTGDTGADTVPECRRSLQCHLETQS